MRPEADSQRADVLAQIEALRELCRCLMDGTPAPPDVATRLVPGLDECLRALDAGEGVSLDAALGLKRHGGGGARKALANAERDKLLRGLVRNHCRWSCMAASLASKDLLSEFSRYESSRWKRDRTSDTAPAAEPYSTFWRLLRNGVQMPGPKRLSQIISVEIEDPL